MLCSKILHRAYNNSINDQRVQLYDRLICFPPFILSYAILTSEVVAWMLLLPNAISIVAFLML